MIKTIEPSLGEGIKHLTFEQFIEFKEFRLTETYTIVKYDGLISEDCKNLLSRINADSKP